MTTQEPTAVTPATANSTVATPTTATAVRHMSEISDDVDIVVNKSFEDFEKEVSRITLSIINVVADKVRSDIKTAEFKLAVVGLKEETHKFYVCIDFSKVFGFNSLRDTLYGDSPSSKFNCLIFRQVQENLMAENIELCFDVNMCDTHCNAVWTKKIITEMDL